MREQDSCFLCVSRDMEKTNNYQIWKKPVENLHINKYKRIG